MDEQTKDKKAKRQKDKKMADPESQILKSDLNIHKIYWVI